MQIRRATFGYANALIFVRLAYVCCTRDQCVTCANSKFGENKRIYHSAHHRCTCSTRLPPKVQPALEAACAVTASGRFRPLAVLLRCACWLKALHRHAPGNGIQSLAPPGQGARSCHANGDTRSRYVRALLLVNRHTKPHVQVRARDKASASTNPIHRNHFALNRIECSIRHFGVAA